MQEDAQAPLATVRLPPPVSIVGPSSFTSSCDPALLFSSPRIWFLLPFLFPHTYTPPRGGREGGKRLGTANDSDQPFFCFGFPQPGSSGRDWLGIGGKKRDVTQNPRESGSAEGFHQGAADVKRGGTGGASFNAGGKRGFLSREGILLGCTAWSTRVNNAPLSRLLCFE